MTKTVFIYIMLIKKDANPIVIYLCAYIVDANLAKQLLF